MAEIELTNGGVAIVDDADHEFLSQWSWYARKGSGQTTWYAVSTGPEKLLMHRVILLPSPSREVDHINHDGLDNRRCNLRSCSTAENQHNNRPIKGSSKFKGVDRRGDRWRARIRVHGSPIYIGVFRSEELAAAAYDEAARLHFGDFACLNFPGGWS